MSRYSMVDYQTIEYLTWILGPEMHVLGAQLAEKAEQHGLSDMVGDLRECLGDPSDYPRTIQRFRTKGSGRSAALVDAMILKLLERRARDLEPRQPAPLEAGIRRMQRAFGFSDLDREVFLLLLAIQGWTPVERYFEDHLCCTSLAGRKFLVALLDTTLEEIEKITIGALLKVGIMEVRAGRLMMTRSYLTSAHDPLSDVMPGGLYRPVPRETLPLSAHNVPREATEHLLSLFRSPAESAANVLIYGPPGTGKSSYARALACEVGLPALEVSVDENDRIELRRMGIVACLRLENEGKGVVVLVDEADVLLNTATSWISRGTPQDKGWLNELLEHPGARMIWIVNDISGVEPSVLRRLAFSVSFDPLTRGQRIRLWDRILRRRKVKRFFDDNDIAALAERYDVSAGVIDLAVQKAAESRKKSRIEIHQAVHLALEAHRTLMNGGRPFVPNDEIAEDYSLEGLNIGGDIKALLRRLAICDRALRRRDAATPRGMNLLFYGPSGTGKSELARYIARHLDRELMVKRASDILGKYVGETERLIAASFSEAEREGAVLVIDEIDSLLFSRESATRSWEVSFTNEMLTRMERFRGILICTTNRFVDLDPASIRRFGEKVEFDFLTPDGIEIFYRKLLTPLVRGPLDEGTLKRLRAITSLAPGDFRVIRDRYAFMEESRPSASELVAALEREAGAKAAHHEAKVGFRLP